jgi:hypothetical protein
MGLRIRRKTTSMASTALTRAGATHLACMRAVASAPRASPSLPVPGSACHWSAQRPHTTRHQVVILNILSRYATATPATSSGEISCYFRATSNGVRAPCDCPFSRSALWAPRNKRLRLGVPPARAPRDVPSTTRSRARGLMGTTRRRKGATLRI